MADGKLRDIFSLIDSDGGGSISLEEVNLFVGALPQTIDPAVVSDAFATQDTSNDGSINVDEFCGLIDKLHEVLGVGVDDMVAHFTRHCYKDLFTLLAEGAEEVRMSDLRQLVESMGTTLSGEELRRIFKQYDEDGSGSIEFEEFVGITEAIGQGMPISALVHSFKEARQAAKERMDALKNRFAAKEATPPVSRQNSTRQLQRMSSAASNVSVPRSVAPCQQCPHLQQRIAELEALLNQERSEASAARDAAAAAEQTSAELRAKLGEKAPPKKAVKKKAVTSDHERELASKCERLEKQVEALQASTSGNQHLTQTIEQLRRQLAEQGGDSDANTLLSQIWALEAALEIRTRELYALRSHVEASAREVEKYDMQLAQSMIAGMNSLAAKSNAEAQSVLGESIESVAKKAKRTVQSRKGQRRAPSVASSVHDTRDTEIEALQAENRRLRQQQQQQPMDQQPPTPAKISSAVVHQAVAAREEALKAVHREEIAGKDRDYELLRKKYKKAQDAIVAAAGQGFEHEVKLHQARRVLQSLIDNPDFALSPQRHLSPVGFISCRASTLHPFLLASSRSTSPELDRCF